MGMFFDHKDDRVGKIQDKIVKYAMITGGVAGGLVGVGAILWGAYEFTQPSLGSYWNVCGVYVPGPVHTSDRICSMVVMSPFALAGGGIGAAVGAILLAELSEPVCMGLEAIVSGSNYISKKFRGIKEEIPQSAKSE